MGRPDELPGIPCSVATARLHLRVRGLGHEVGCRSHVYRRAHDEPLVVDDEAFLSRHLGDLPSATTRAAFERTPSHLLRVREVDPVIVMHDLHPDIPFSHPALPFAAKPAPLLAHLLAVPDPARGAAVFDATLGPGWIATRTALAGLAPCA